MTTKLDRSTVDAEVAKSTSDFLAWQRSADKLVALAKMMLAERLETRATIAALERRVAELETERVKSLSDFFRGAWQSPQPYQRGALVVHDGSTYLALADSIGRKPGTCAEWKQICRAGRDAKE